METKCCLVFDVGKTNQKYFVFNTENKILKREKVTIPKVLDEDGHMAENIEGIVTWLRESFDLTNVYSIRDIKPFPFESSKNDKLYVLYTWLVLPL